MKSAATVFLVIAAISAPSAIHYSQVEPSVAATRQQTASEDHGSSLYQLDSNWETDDERSLKLNELRGRCQILALMFTRCSGICPLTVSGLQAFYRQLPHDAVERIHVTLVTIDQSDTSELLRDYRKRMKLDKDWLLLRGTSESIRELSALLGFSYEAQGDQFAHSNQVNVLDPDGVVAHQQAGAGGSTQELNDALQRVCSR